MALNPIATRAWTRLLREHPDWQGFLGTRAENELEVAVPAPEGSKAGHLVVFTSAGDIWVRYSPPHMCYALDDDDEMINIVNQLVSDQAVFLVVMRDEQWVETTLIRPDQDLALEPGQEARVISWSGVHDRVVTAK